jgi:hypothetical protein
MPNPKTKQGPSPIPPKEQGPRQSTKALESSPSPKPPQQSGGRGFRTLLNIISPTLGATYGAYKAFTNRNNLEKGPSPSPDVPPSPPTLESRGEHLVKKPSRGDRLVKKPSRGDRLVNEAPHRPEHTLNRSMTKKTAKLPVSTVSEITSKKAVSSGRYGAGR